MTVLINNTLIDWIACLLDNIGEVLENGESTAALEREINGHDTRKSNI